MNHYKSITQSALLKHLRAAKWVISTNRDSMGELDWILSCYRPGNSVAGYTDYENHISLGKTLAHYKKETRECIKTRLLQIGNYYNIDGKPFDTVLIVLGRSGWSAEAIWSDGSKCYFTHKYEESAKIYAAQREKEEAARKERARLRRQEKRQQLKNGKQ